jgi:hypothetical protein
MGTKLHSMNNTKLLTNGKPARIKINKYKIFVDAVTGTVFIVGGIFVFLLGIGSVVILLETENPIPLYIIGFVILGILNS